MEKAHHHLTEALRLKPDFLEAQNNLGIVLQELGQFDAAIECFHKVLERDPQQVETYNNLGNTYKEQGKLKEAIECYHKALRYQPNFLQAHHNLAVTSQEDGHIEETLKHYDYMVSFKAEPGIRVKQALLLPPIYQSIEDLNHWRKRFIDNLTALQEENIQLKDPFQEVGITHFYLTYQGLQDRILQEKVAEFYPEKIIGIMTPQVISVDEVIKTALSKEKTVVMDFRISPDEKVMPMVPAGASLKDMIVED